MLSKNGRLKFTLNNIEGDAPIEWEDVSVKASFKESVVEPKISAEALTFANEQAKQIKDWIAQGRIFEGMPFLLQSYNADTSFNTFRGYVNCSKGVEIIDNTTVKARVQKPNNIFDVKERMSGITMSYLESINVFTDSDYTKIKYVVEKSDNGLEILFSSIVIYSLYVQLETQIKEISFAPVEFSAHATGGVPGPAAAAIFGVALGIINVIFTALIVVAMINLALKVFQILQPIPRTHRAINLRTALSKISTYLGYNFESNIAILNKLVYLPSNFQVDEFNLLTGVLSLPKGTKSGLPNERDFGFTALEFFELCEKMFEAQIKIVDGTLNFRTKSDPFWEQSATYKMPDVLREVKRYNTDELVFSRLIRFDTDEIADEWTINNFKGTNYEVITNDPSINNKEADYIDTHETIRIPVCLGNRKDRLNPLENTLAAFAATVDATVNFFGGNLNLRRRITSKIGMLRVGTNNTTKPKILYVNGSKLPVNHRELFSAKTLYQQFISEKSFVLNNFRNQKALYTLNDIPFGFEDFLKTIENSNFTDSDNNLAKFRELDCLLAGDTANVVIEQREIYAPNLTETYIEAE